MGRQVAAIYGESAHKMILTDVAAIGVAGATNELILWVGDNALPRMVEVGNRAVKCIKAWAELSGPLPTALAFGTYHMNIDASTATAVPDAAVPTLSEDDVAVIIGDTFYPAAGNGSSQAGESVLRMALNVLLEDRKNA